MRSIKIKMIKRRNKMMMAVREKRVHQKVQQDTWYCEVHYLLRLGDYSDMNFSDFEDSLDDGSDDEERGGRGSSGGKEKEDLNEMERLLLDNLSSSDEEEIDVKTSKNNKRGRQGDDDEEEIFNKKSKRYSASKLGKIFY